jgi:DNA-binding CsgD family transcriptional regulator
MDQGLLKSVSQSLVQAVGQAREVEDLCQFLVLDTLVAFGALAAVFFSLGMDGQLRPSCSFGLGSQNEPTSGIAPLLGGPLAQAIRARTPFLLSADDSVCVHPDFPAAEQHSLCIPAEQHGVGAGVLIVILDSGTATPSNSILLEVATLIRTALNSILLRLDMSLNERKPPLAPRTLSARFRELTTRQVLIMGHVALGKTNKEIGRELNISESLVKKELVEIYKLLGTSTRLESISVFEAAIIPPPPAQPEKIVTVA